MKEHLQPWYDRWLEAHKDTDLLWANPRGKDGPSLGQVHFVRDTLGSLMWADVPYEQRPVAAPRECKESAFVIGEHRSKSVRLPVYSLERPDLGLQVVLRDNYHDWNISVLSETPIASEVLSGFPLDYWSDEERTRFQNGYKPGSYWGYCFFQGFPEELQFGPHRENPRRFSLCVGSDYSVYTLLWLILRERRNQ